MRQSLTPPVRDLSKKVSQDIEKTIKVKQPTLSSPSRSLQVSLVFRIIFGAYDNVQKLILLDFSLTVKAATLIFISGRGSAISSAKEGKSGFIYNLVKS